MIRLRRRRAARLSGRVAGALALAATALTVAACGGGEPASDAPRTTPASGLPATFVGIVAPEVKPFPAEAEIDQALDAQAKAGITLFRQPFLWQEIEPEEGTFNFVMYDRLVGKAARNGITIMPIVFGVRPGEAAPKKPGARITPTTTRPPKSNARFAQYATLLVKRYGHGGSFWADNPSIPAKPITAWQVWNEPNLPAYWGGVPNAREYTRLLKTTAKAIRAADPEAEILTGGLPESKLGTPLLTFIRQMVKAGAADSFDTLAVHPYAQNANAVFQGARDAQQAAEKAGATGKALWITEIGWPTGGPRSSFTVSEDRQAKLVVDLLRIAADRAADLRLHGVIYYAWRDAPPAPGASDFWGNHTGLVTRDLRVKPALSSFAAAAKGL